jgi:hypothetical protein
LRQILIFLPLSLANIPITFKIGTMRLCNRCLKAENPKGNLSFRDSPEGSLCENCYKRFYSYSYPADAAESELVVITCPDCRGKHHSSHGLPCVGCKGFGAVRIAKSSLPVYTVEIEHILIEESDDNV